MRRTITAATWPAIAAAIAAMSIFRITCFDVWWHLKTGEYILTHHTVPVTDVFSYTAAGRTWITHEWLFEVLLFLVYRLGALPGVILLNAGIVLTAFAFTTLTLRRLKVASWLGAPLVILAAFLVTFRAFCRPHIVTECLLALYLFVLLAYKHDPAFRVRRGRLWWLVPVQLVWANAHSGVVLGIGLLAAFIIAEALQSWLARKGTLDRSSVLTSAELRFLAGLALALLAVSFINPNLHRSLLYSLIITREPVLAGGIRELQTPFLSSLRQTDFLHCFIVLLGLGVGSFVLNWRRLQLSHLVFFLASAFAASLALRNLPIFGLLSAPIVALNFQQVLGARISRRRALADSGALLLALGVLVMVFTRGVQVGAERRKPGFGYDERMVPRKAADFVERSGIKDRVFSTMEYGGYFIWRWFPERKVFIDGRVDPFGADLFRLYGRVFWSSSVTDSVISAYDINCFVLPQPPSNTASTSHYIGRTLGQRPDWSLVYWDDVAMVYVRNIPEHQELTRKHAYHALAPLLLGLPEADQGPDTGYKATLLAEAERAVSENPASPLALSTLGAVRLRFGQRAEGQAAFEKALAADPDYVEGIAGLALLHARAQEYPEAIRLLERAVRLEPDNGIVLLNLGLVYHRVQDDRKAVRLLSKAIEVNPGQVMAYVTLGDIYLAQGRRDAARETWEQAQEIEPGNSMIRMRLAQLGTGRP